jgi:type IX secretion system PorP/SprF family membrane protein
MLKMKYIIVLVVISFSTTLLKAQQLEQWTQFYMNEYMINPTAAGSDPYFHANALYRDQWVGIQDSPRTYYLSLHGPIVKETMGIGGAVFSDVVGQTRRSGFQGTYAYHFKLTKDYRLSFSLSTGMLQFSVDGNKLDLEQNNDIALSNGFMSIWSLDFGSGARFSGKNFHVGIYVPQIAGLKAQFFNDYAATENVLARHYYLNAGYRYDFDDNWAIDANFLGRYVSPMDMFDLQVRGIFQDMIWLGASYRSPIISDQLPSAVGIMAGYQFQNNLTIGYAYDLDVGRIGAATTGSHEIALGIRFTKRNAAPIIPADQL